MRVIDHLAVDVDEDGNLRATVGGEAQRFERHAPQGEEVNQAELRTLVVSFDIRIPMALGVCSDESRAPRPNEPGIGTGRPSTKMSRCV